MGGMLFDERYARLRVFVKSWKVSPLVDLTELNEIVCFLIENHLFFSFCLQLFTKSFSETIVSNEDYGNGDFDPWEDFILGEVSTVFNLC